jgi:hypothetical protein
MTRDDLKRRLMTDAELIEQYFELTGARVSIDEKAPDSPGSRWARNLAFDYVMQDAAIVLAPDERTDGPRMGSFAEDDPAAHAALASTPKKK